MAGFDADRVFSVSVYDNFAPTAPDSPAGIEKLLLEFLLQYRVGGEFIYRCVPRRVGAGYLLSDPFTSDKLRANLLLKQYQLEVDLRHLSLYNDELAHAIQDRPADILPLVSTPNLHETYSSSRMPFSLRMLLPRLLAPSFSRLLVARTNRPNQPCTLFLNSRSQSNLALVSFSSATSRPTR